MSNSKKSSVRCLLAVAAIAAATPTQAEDNFYGQFGAGYQHREAASDEAGTTTFDNGYNLNGAFGYRYKQARFELEGAYFDNDASTTDPTGPSIGKESSSGNVDIRSALLNAYYDMALPNPAFTVYGGIGLGTYKVEIHDLTTPTLTAYGILVNGESDWEVAMQLKAGVNYQVNPQTLVFAGYRYFRGGDLAIDNGPLGVIHPNDPELHNFELGVRLYF